MNEQVMSKPEKDILSMIVDPAPELPYPLKEVEFKEEGLEKDFEYEIPEDEKEEVLKKLYPFWGCPEMDDVRLDLHSQKHFIVKDFRVIRYNDRNLLVAPEYHISGGMVVDWMPPESPEMKQDDED